MQKKHIYMVILSVLALLVLGALAFFLWSRGGTPKKDLTVEVGTKLPEASEFFHTEKNSKVVYKYAADISTIDMNKVGETQVELLADRKKYSSLLIIEDTVSPTAEAVNQTIFAGTALIANTFVKNIVDGTDVSTEFVTPPDFNKAGTQEVELSLTDQGGNETKLKANLSVIILKPFLSVEAGSGSYEVMPRDFIESFEGSDGITLHFANRVKFDFTKVNTIPVIIEIADESKNQGQTEFRVVDTTAPTAEAVSQMVYKGKKLKAADFVKAVFDQSEVAITFDVEPNFMQVGEHGVDIVLTDSANNKNKVTSLLKVNDDTEAPLITGDLDKTCHINSSVSYKEGVTVRDNSGEPIALQVDSSQVDLSTAGKYEVSYSATDLAGNKTSSKGSITVTNPEDDAIYAMADEVLSKIVNEGMSQEEKLRAIYAWVRGHVSYVSAGSKDSVILGAYRAFKIHKGDCYTFYAVSELLMNRVGIENIPVTRMGGRARHFWSLVNLGEGWYHYDSTPYRTVFNGCMFTESQAEKYTAERRDNYYVYDKTLYSFSVEQ